VIALKTKHMNSNLRTDFAFVFILLIGMIIGSCKTQKSMSAEGFQNEYFGIKGLKCTDTKSPDAIDSQVGTLDCETISFTYDFGPFSNPGPLTPEEEFRRTFDTYHHNKFFENRMIDPKVYKIFLDSVKVIDVDRKKEDDRLLIECKPCNAVAEITFLGETYFYPFTLSERQLNMEGFTCSFEERGEFVYKYFQEDDGLPGLYITPKKNRFKSKNTLSLITKETTLTIDEVQQLLRMAYIVE